MREAEALWSGKRAAVVRYVPEAHVSEKVRKAKQNETEEGRGQKKMAELSDQGPAKAMSHLLGIFHQGECADKKGPLPNLPTRVWGWTKAFAGCPGDPNQKRKLFGEHRGLGWPHPWWL